MEQTTDGWSLMGFSCQKCTHMTGEQVEKNSVWQNGGGWLCPLVREGKTFYGGQTAQPTEGQSKPLHRGSVGLMSTALCGSRNADTWSHKDNIHKGAQFSYRHKHTDQTFALTTRHLLPALSTDKQEPQEPSAQVWHLLVSTEYCNWGT